jgi:hypothetical protein
MRGARALRSVADERRVVAATQAGACTSSRPTWTHDVVVIASMELRGDRVAAVFGWGAAGSRFRLSLHQGSRTGVLISDFPPLPATPARSPTSFVYGWVAVQANELLALPAPPLGP